MLGLARYSGCGPSRSIETFQWWLFAFVAVFCMILQTDVECRFRRAQDSLLIKVHTVQPTSVDLIWTSPNGNESEMQRWTMCDIIVFSPHDKRRHVLENYSLQNHVITLHHLSEKTAFTLFFTCRLNGTAFQSNLVHFSTGSHSEPTSTTAVPSRVHYDEEDEEGDSTNMTSSGLNHNSGEPEETPTIYKNKLNPFSNVLDATLGIMFAVVGGIVAIVTGCYFWRNYRRRQRLHQFVRHEDSSDGFETIQRNMAET